MWASQPQMSTEPSTQDALGESRFRERIHTHKKTLSDARRKDKEENETCTPTSISVAAHTCSAFGKLWNPFDARICGLMMCGRNGSSWVTHNLPGDIIDALVLNGLSDRQAHLVDVGGAG